MCRTGAGICYTDAPCVIAEPFFIDNDGDLARAQEDPNGLASAYARAIEAMAEVVYLMDGNHSEIVT